MTQFIQISILQLGTQLKLSEQPDFEQETLVSAKKEQSEHRCSDCYHLSLCN